MTSLVIRAPRLELRPLADGHLAWLHALNAEPGVRRYLFDDEVWTEAEVRERLLVENARLWRQEGRGLCVVREVATSRDVGWCGFWYFHEPAVREVAYAMHPTVWGRGFAAEAARAVMVLGWQVHGDTAFRASTDAPNVASIRVLHTLGFVEQRRSAGRVHETLHFHRGAEGLDLGGVTIGPTRW